MHYVELHKKSLVELASDYLIKGNNVLYLMSETTTIPEHLTNSVGDLCAITIDNRNIIEALNKSTFKADIVMIDFLSNHIINDLIKYAFSCDVSVISNIQPPRQTESKNKCMTLIISP